VAEEDSDLEDVDLEFSSDYAAGDAVSASEGCDTWQGEDFICEIEFPEHDLVRRWIPQNATVMEFGARFGTTTCEIAKQLGNSGAVLAVEPDPFVWSDLQSNLELHKCNAGILRGAVSSSDFHMNPGNYGNRPAEASDGDSARGTLVSGSSFSSVQSAFGKTVDTFLIDCEGCVIGMLDQIGPPIENGQIKLIVLEADQPDDVDYDEFFSFLETNGFQKVDQINDCDRARSGAREETQCFAEIEHVAYRRA